MLLVVKFGILFLWHLEFRFTVLLLLAGCNIVRITCESSVALDQIQGVDVWRENFEQVCLNLIHSLEKYKTHLPDCPFIK